MLAARVWLSSTIHTGMSMDGSCGEVTVLRTTKQEKARNGMGKVLPYRVVLLSVSTEHL
jgi:hypothetical protein